MGATSDFSENLNRTLSESIGNINEGKAQIIIVEKETEASREPVLRAVESLRDSGMNLWTANCAGRSAPLFEQLLPQHMKNIVRMEKPPRIEIGLIANKVGMNMGTVTRGDSSLDPDIISGMMDAVRNFVKDSLTMHKGESLEEGGFERFEMYDYNILVYVSKDINLTLILSGSINESLKEDIRKVTKSIEEEFGDKLTGWGGNVSELDGIENSLSMVLFSSKKYEGVWDFDTLKLLQARMQDDTVKAITSSSLEQPLILIIEELELTDPGSLSLLNYLTRNIEERKILLLLTYAQSGSPQLSDTLDRLKELEFVHEMFQPPDVDVSLELESMFPENFGTIRTILSHGAVLGVVDNELITESTGIEPSVIYEAIGQMTDAGLITSDGLPMSRSLYTTIISGLENGELHDIKVSMARAIESKRPEDIRNLSGQYIWLAAENSEFSTKATEYARKMAEEHTRTYNLEGAVDMWLSAFKFEQNPGARMGDLLNVVKLEFILSDMDGLHEHNKALLELAVSEGDKLHQGHAHWYNARWFGRKDRNQEALETIKVTVECFEELGDKENMGFAMNSQALIHNSLGERDEALDILQRVLIISDELKNPVLKARALTNSAYIQMIKKDLIKAEELLLSALEATKSVSSVFDKAAILWHLGLLAYRKEEYDACIEWCNKALSEATRTSNWRTAVQAHTTLSAAHDKLDNYEMSEKHSMEALALSERTEAGDTLALTYNMFDLQFKKGMDWLRRTLEVSINVKAYPETLQELRTEILIAFAEHLELISEFIDSTDDLEQRKKVAEQLRILLERLDV